MEQTVSEVVLKHIKDGKVIWNSQLSLTKCKSCLTNPVAFCGGVTTSVDKGRITDIIYRDSVKRLTQFPPDILLSKLERGGFEEWIIMWTRKQSASSSKFASDPRLSAAVDTPEGWDSIQRDLDKLHKLALGKLMRFNKTKPKTVSMQPTCFGDKGIALSHVVPVGFSTWKLPVTSVDGVAVGERVTLTEVFFQCEGILAVIGERHHNKLPFEFKWSIPLIALLNDDMLILTRWTLNNLREDQTSVAVPYPDEIWCLQYTIVMSAI
ncbi:hypothetical protein HGM15179_010805 [Zosterops borbonicus]|uniref:Uncharacterized protein n=1 Tax=Zosterops borbonicus TaxID=364589 RepID=A0A8K1LJN0_9PASS|nr:hypothetical protein HGM15179_010805 [Zosterops borbonicus]